MKKIFIAGHKGMVGSAIFRKLKNNSNKIVIADKKKLNLLDQKSVLSFFKRNKFDEVYLCAAKVGGIYANDTLRTEFLIENLKINTNILESCIPNTNIEIINLGSSCIYPLDATNPIKESALMTGKLEPTNSPYAMAKLTAIEMGKSLSYQYGHKIVNLMPTNLYGPNDNFSDKESHVIPGLMGRMHKAKENKAPKFEVWGTGKPLREFLYVDDLADAIGFVIKNDIDLDLLNIGSNEEVSINDLVKCLEETINYKGEIVFNDSYPDGNPRKLLDSSRIFDLGWKPTVDINTGLKITYQWYLDNKV